MFHQQVFGLQDGDLGEEFVGVVQGDGDDGVCQNVFVIQNQGLGWEWFYSKTVGCWSWTLGVKKQDCWLEGLQCGFILGQEDLFGSLGNYRFVM